MRGGPRPGAGRPKGSRKLRGLARWAIGGHCEEIWREAQRAATDEAVAKATKHFRKEMAYVDAVPLDERTAWLASCAYEDHKDNVRFALQTDQGLDDDQEPARYITVVAKRPMGLKDEIIKKVAAEESAKHGIDIAPRYVKTCWSEFRKMQQSLRDHV